MFYRATSQVLSFLILSVSACSDAARDQVAPESSAALDASTTDGSVDAIDANATQASDGSSTSDANVAVDTSLPPGASAVTIRFRAKVGSDDFACGRPALPAPGARFPVEPIDFRFFIDRLRLITRSGQEVPVQLSERLPYQTSEVALIDFTSGSGACLPGVAAANTMVTGAVPTGDYSGIAFSTAVPLSLNHGDPALAPLPLQTPGAHWTWRQGYRFLLASVRAQRNQDAGVLDARVNDAGGSDAGSPPASGGHGGGAAPGYAELHVGALGCLGGVGVGFNCQIPNRNEVRLMQFDPMGSTVVADLGALFAGLDVLGGIACHDNATECGSAYSALGLDPTTGAPLSTQQVFRLE
jgi:uncharacterized repeat protein (TIGR04052 family)